MKKFLISQSAPGNLSAYKALSEKYGVVFEFHPFFKIAPLSGAEFRAQHIDLSQHTAVVFSSRHAIDAYFSLCDEARFKVPETMKYFCTSELIANYLQKHVVYRKRKIFFGTGTPESVISMITARHSGEKYLITTSDTANGATFSKLLEEKHCEHTTGVLVKPIYQNLTGMDLTSYELIVLYNQFDVQSLFASFPDFRQGDVKFLAFGKGIVRALNDAGLSVALQGPTPETPSVVKALDLYLSGK